MAQTRTLPEEFVTRVDFGKFWAYYIRGPLTKDMLLQAKRDLLDAGVPTLTVYAYFFDLHSTLAEGGNEGLVEPIMDDLIDLHNLEYASLEETA